MSRLLTTQAAVYHGMPRHDRNISSRRVDRDVVNQTCRAISRDHRKITTYVPVCSKSPVVLGTCTIQDPGVADVYPRALHDAAAAYPRETPHLISSLQPRTYSISRGWSGRSSRRRVYWSFFRGRIWGWSRRAVFENHIPGSTTLYSCVRLCHD